MRNVMIKTGKGAFWKLIIESGVTVRPRLLNVVIEE